MISQKKILIDSVFKDLESMGIDISMVKRIRADEIATLQTQLNAAKSKVACPFCLKSYPIIPSTNHGGIVTHIETEHHADIH